MVDPVEVFPSPSVAVMVICAVCSDPLTAPSLVVNVAEYEEPPPLTPDIDPKLADALTDETPLGSDTVIEIFA